jgi:mono/diheme cytochrome c family protein
MMNIYYLRKSNSAKECLGGFVMKKYGSGFKTFLVLTFSVFLSTALYAEERPMHEKMGDETKSMEKKAEKPEHEGHHEMMPEAHWMAPPEEAKKTNPVKPTEESLAKAAGTFKERCTICHGESGKGDGVLSDSLDPKPRDLTGELTRSHPDGDLFYKISTGKGAMPAWAPSLSEEERWGMVNYIRSLSKQGE